ncbi:MAG: bifunctional phosphopantothenoylcysteine decarboxylase/phosphopantothenate--cysteine ligase CoaBC [Synergistaceae bacterium]|nr:bifunctional phosphopantothenoylcysteine decarboxylase/phosphopantothenate--cysteine ligase CoaBC [Synergistaceae bacterium]
MEWKKGRRVLLGVTGGIAAYKIPELVRRLRGAGNEVEIILTESAEKLVSPLALSTLSGRRVWLQKDFLDFDNGWKIPHVTLAEWAEVVCIAPCTANMLRRAANGEAETLLGATLLATRAPVLLCPAMNTNMWEHVTTARHKENCLRNGYRILEPDTGSLACGTEGRGRLPLIEDILEEIWRLLCPVRDLEGKNVLVTAGPTWEFMDPVRFISNPSSGKMGYAIAQSAWYRGADVTIVSGPVAIQPPHGVSLVKVQSAVEMLQAVLEKAETADFIVKAAAVGDYRPKHFSSEKIKRSGKADLEVKFEQNPDIAATVGTMKKTGQVLVGFAAESHHLERNAIEKMNAKNLDYIVANRITGPDGAFGSDRNSIHVLGRNGRKLNLSGSKEEVAWGLWDFILEAGSFGAPRD